MNTASGVDLPIHLVGNNAPVSEEVTVEPREVLGKVPVELFGRYVRNGPNPRTGWSPHAFAGDGMVHSVVLEGGQARSYRNRYIRTPLYENPGVTRFVLAFDPVTSRIDHRVSTANTHVIAHGGRLLALEEGGFAYELTLDLDTIGPFTFGGALETPMTAHPKICPITRELLFFGSSVRPPHLTYHRAAPDGLLIQSQVVAVRRATMMHDFAITEKHVIFMDLPVVFDRQMAVTSGLPWRWDEAHGARFGVMARSGTDAAVRWFEIEPCYVFHTMNAFEASDSIIVTGCRLPSLWRQGPDDVSGGLPTLHRWNLHLPTGTVTEMRLDDLPSEYPRVADAEVGRPNRYGYATSVSWEREADQGEIYKYDLRHGAARTVHRFPAGHTCGEPVFVPRSRCGTAETGDDGYLMTFAHDRGRGTSYLAILDAANLEADPIAEVHLPVRVPAGFHGNWVPSS
ncbi:carotenoid oxygenase family protein [Sorangium sp. So ce1128]